MHDEGDEAGEYDRPKKPRGDQGNQLPVQGAASGRSRAVARAGADDAAADTSLS
jgi:hypothetical protein